MAMPSLVSSIVSESPAGTESVGFFSPLYSKNLSPMDPGGAPPAGAPVGDAPGDWPEGVADAAGSSAAVPSSSLTAQMVPPASTAAAVTNTLAICPGGARGV